MAVKDVYMLCSICTHTINIHGDGGCHAYKCQCKESYEG